MRACLERICNSEMMRHTGTGGALMLSIAALQSVMKIAQGLQLHASSRELGSFDGPWAVGSSSQGPRWHRAREVVHEETLGCGKATMRSC